MDNVSQLIWLLMSSCSYGSKEGKFLGPWFKQCNPRQTSQIQAQPHISHFPLKAVLGWMEVRSPEHIIPNVIVVVLRYIISKASFAICSPYSPMPTAIWLCNELKSWNATTWVLSEWLWANRWYPSITILTLISLIIVSSLNNPTKQIHAFLYDTWLMVALNLFKLFSCAVIVLTPLFCKQFVLYIFRSHLLNCEKMSLESLYFNCVIKARWGYDKVTRS